MKRFIAFLFFLLVISVLKAQPALPAVFSDNMVLQQNTNVAIWGKTQPNAEIELLGSWMNEKIRTTADATGNFHPAQAKIIGHTIEVWNDDVKQPKHVRYAWKNWVYTNLVNSEGLPAVPFKTN